MAAIDIQKSAATTIEKIRDYLGDEADDLLSYECKLSSALLHPPGPDFVDRISWV